ncbi:MAG: SWIM zinc finger domain-containing protein, partial [Chloroflexota bacterium]
LDLLRGPSSYYPHGQVDIFLHEGLLDDAIAAVDQGATHELVERVVDAVLATHPDWAIQMSRRQAEAIMNAAKAQYYVAAAGWLRRMRTAYQATGREADWQSYLQTLLEHHRRKRNLMPLLTALR